MPPEIFIHTTTRRVCCSVDVDEQIGQLIEIDVRTSVADAPKKRIVRPSVIESVPNALTISSWDTFLEIRSFGASFPERCTFSAGANETSPLILSLSGARSGCIG